MSVTTCHRGDYAIVPFSADLTLSSATELVESVDSAINTYLYREVEILVQSRGGQVAALDYLVRAFLRWHEDGIRVRARVATQAGSAAALLVALAEERVAEPGATLLFHHVHLSGLDSVSARRGAQIHSTLTRLDERLIGQIVDRVRAAPACDGDHAAALEPDDHEPLERLVAVLGLTVRRRSLKRMARAVGSAVARAVRAGDRRTLVRVYRCVCATDCLLSAALAHTLRLVDRVEDGSRRAVRRTASSGLRVPQWQPLFPPYGDVAREVLTRHVLVLGETGSGKTASAVLPLVTAMARGSLGAALVIDPKHEIGPVLERIVPDRVETLSVSTMTLDLMADPRWSLAEDLAAGRWLTAATRILMRVASFVPGSPARVLGAHPISEPTTEFFDREGTDLLRAVLGFVLMVTRPDAPAPMQWLADDEQALGWVEELVARARGHAEERGPNAVALAAWVVDTGLAPLTFDLFSADDAVGASVADTGLKAPESVLFPFDGEDELDKWRYDPPAPEAAAPSSPDSERPILGWPTPPEGGEAVCMAVRSDAVGSARQHWLFARVARAARAVPVFRSCEGRDLLARIAGYWADQVEIDRQYAGVRSTASVACSELAAPALARTLYFGCEPGYEAALASGAVQCDFARAVSPGRGDGRLVLFQPARDGQDAMVAMALKALFFEAVLSDPDRARGGKDLPLVGYVADEFQRFVTSDRVHGEQSFLDTCRSFGATCVLACQSVSGIEHALTHGTGDPKRNATAVSMLWANTATKLLFRSTDVETARRLADLAPRHSGTVNVVRVRPLSTLAPGECYALLADGAFERRQLVPFTLCDEKAPRTAQRSRRPRRRRRTRRAEASPLRSERARDTGEMRPAGRISPAHARDVQGDRS